jgi:uncharacterized phage-associated protein
MYSALDIANYFLGKADEDAGDLISNLKLQKLLYYAQGFHIALKDAPLFKEPIEAWTHGPVVPQVYHEFKGNGNGSIEGPTHEPEIDQETSSILDEVYSVYGQFSAWKLRNMTHDELPWKTTPSTGEISHESLREYFSTQLA